MVRTTNKLSRFTVLLVVASSYLLSGCNSGRQEDWPTYGGNHAGNRYSPLDQINLVNVKDLQVAWMYNAADKSDPNVAKPTRAMEIQCQPIVVDGILYATTPSLKALP